MANPNDLLRHHVTGAIERGEAVAITEKPAPHVQTINIGPTNWQEQTGLLLVLIERGDRKGNAMAREELLRMAKLADLYVASSKAGRVVTELPE